MRKFIFALVMLASVATYAAPPPGLLLSHAKFVGTTPAMGACGTNPAIVGNDSSGTITVGTGGVATDCILTFAQTWVSVPKCFVSDRTQIIALKVVPTATNVTITASAAFTASSILDYFCTNYQ